MADLRILSDYQVEGAQWLAKRSQALLADEPGVGKSAQAVRACDLVGARDILVLVPASARVNWIREFEKFSPFDRPAVAVLDGKTPIGASGITVCSYDLVSASPKLRKSLLVRSWDAIILDEAHYLKSRKAGRTKAVYGRRGDGVGALTERAKHVWRLTGTPAPNNVSELWTHLRSGGVYDRDWYTFVAEFCTGFESDYGFKITGTKNEDRLKQLLSGFMLRRKKEDVMPKLPPLRFEHHALEPSPVDYLVNFPQAHITNGVAILKAEVEKQNAILTAAWRGTRATTKATDAVAALTALAPSLGTLRRWIGLAKVPQYLERVYEELRTGEIDKLVVFAYNKQVIEFVHDGLSDFGAVTLYGETPAVKRQRRIDKFQTDPKCRVFIGQLQAAGTAITLTAAHRVDVLQESYVPGENAQAILRCHRRGQTKAVTVRFFGCARSIDAEISKAHMRKTEELAKVFD